MDTTLSTIVQRLWNYCNVLRDDGIFVGATRPSPDDTLDNKGTLPDQKLASIDGSPLPTPDVCLRERVVPMFIKIVRQIIVGGRLL